MNPLDKLDLGKTEQNIRTLCRGWGCPEQDLDDVVQETLLIVAQGNPNVSNAASLALRRSLPRAGARVKYVDPHWLDEFPSDSPCPDEHAEIREEVDRAMDRLEEEDQQIFQWRKEGYTLEKIGDMLGIGVAAVHWRIDHAQELLDQNILRGHQGSRECKLQETQIILENPLRKCLRDAI